MAAPAPLSADSLLALAGLLSSGSGNADSADAVGPGAGQACLPEPAAFSPQAQGPADDRSGPGSIGPPKAGGASAAPLPPEEGKAIWSAEEVTEGKTGDASWDPREQPEYEIVFKQQVRAEDLFLGVSRKDPSTACCEDMLIKIKLPDTKASDITLDIQEKLLDFRSPQKYAE